MAAPTQVVHVNDPEGYDVYIGRGAPRARDAGAHYDTIWRNQYRITPTSSTSRDRTAAAQLVVRLFRLWLVNGHDIGADELAAMTEGEAILAQAGAAQEERRRHLILERAVAELAGRRLGCWCAPHGAPYTAEAPAPHVCHGQVLAELADGILVPP